MRRKHYNDPCPMNALKNVTRGEAKEDQAAAA
jgi:hypothetical protein